MTVFRTLTEADAKAMASLHRKAFHPAAQWSEAEFSTLISASATFGFALSSAETLQTFALIQFIPSEAEILTLATDPVYQRQSLAQALLQKIEHYLQPQGLNRWLLDVAETNKGAIAFYQSLGFSEDGRRPGYYRRADGHHADAILMSRNMGGQP